MPQETEWKSLSNSLSKILLIQEEDERRARLREILANDTAPNIALALEDIDPENPQEIFKEIPINIAGAVLSKVDSELKKKILAQTEENKINSLITELSPRETASILTEIPSNTLHTILKDECTKPEAIVDVKKRINYKKETAGRLMTTQFIRIDRRMKISEAVNEVLKSDPSIDVPNDMYVVEKYINKKGFKLVGVISIRDAIMHDQNKCVEDVMETNVVSVQANVGVIDAAAILAKYQFNSIPVTDENGDLIGVLPADDLMSVVATRLRKLYSQAVGTDAELMDRLSPAQAAKKRVPWLLGTMAIELCAGVVIAGFDEILSKVILLASFMPVISAISGNVGLQAAAITVRALDSGHAREKKLWPAIKKEMATSLLMAIICGAVLGIIGGIWAHHFLFGVVIGIALPCSMMTAGLMGTVIPVISKRFGLDPATTAGPFETAFQDVIGFAVFLSLATLLQQWIS
ncbi:MAG: magnesium transporter, partial [Bacteroidetes bacterium]|nr:magnesium transporter [Bacteroidota bacterium]